MASEKPTICGLSCVQAPAEPLARDLRNTPPINSKGPGRDDTMKTIDNAAIARIISAAALALIGLAPIAEARSFAGLDNGPTIGPKTEIFRKANPELLTPAPELGSGPIPAPEIGSGPALPPPAVQLVTVHRNGPTVEINGSNDADDVTIKIDDTNQKRMYVYDGNDLLSSFPSHAIKYVYVNLKGGDDYFGLRLANNGSLQSTKDISVTLGAGDDYGSVELRGNWKPTLLGTLKMKVNAGSGDDEVIANFARKHGGKLEFKCQGAAGDDTCWASMWGDVTGGADVKFDLFGNGGNDSITSWNTYDSNDGAYGKVRISGDSTMDIRMDGGSGADKLTPTFSGEADGDLTLNVRGRTGKDSSYGIVDLKNSGGEVLLKTKGEGGDDDLRLDVFGSTPYFSAKINGGGGFDTCLSTPNVVKSGCP